MEKVSYKVILLTIAVFAVGMWSVPGLTLSAPNWEINYQGKLTDNTGALVANGNYDMEFKLYTVPTGGSAIWTETLTGANQVPVTNGLFSVMLGSTTALTGVNFNQTLYLGVNIAADGEMTPRKVLGAVPAAFEADNAATLGGVASTSFLRSDEADSASGLLTFTGGLISNSSSTITELTFLTATGTTLVLGGDTITDITGSGLALAGSALTANISESNLNIAGGPTNGYVLQASSTATGGFVWTATSTLGFLSDTTGNWTGTFDGQEGSYYLALANATGDTDDLTEGGANLFYTDARVSAYIAGSSSILTTATEAGLEAYLTDVTNVYTNNDGTLADDDLSNNTTTDLAEGTNLYFTTTRASTTATQVLSGTTTLPNLTTLANLSTIGTITSGTWQGSVIDETYLDADVLVATDIGTSVQGYNANTTVLGSTINANELATEDFGDFTCNGTTCSLDATYLTSVDISDNTNLSVTATGLELSGDAIALSANYTIPLTASTTEWATFYTTPSTRITAGTGISWSGNTLNLDNDFGASIDESELNIVAAPTDGYVLQASSTSAGGFVWVATSTLGIDGGGGGGLTSADIDTSAELAAILTDETGTAGSVVFSTSPTFTGTAIFATASSTNASTTGLTATNAYLSNLNNVAAIDTTTESTIEAAIDTLANLTSASALSTIGTITSGTWQGTAVTDTYVADTLTLETISGTPVITNGVRIGTDDTDHLIDEASNGAGSATLYIGNESILASGDIGTSVQGYNANTTVLGSTINANELATEDFGDFTCNGTTCSLDATYLTSVDISDNTNLSVTATGLELSGDAIALSANYTIPLTASTTEWATAFGWGDHSTAGYLSSVSPSDLALTNGYVLRGSATNVAEATSTLFIANNGNVGIGTTSPETSLDVSGTVLIDNNSSYAGEDTIGSNIALLKIDTNDNTVINAKNGEEIRFTIGSSDNKLTILDSGSVGIGTTSPSNLLHIYGDTSDGKVLIEDVNSAARLNLFNSITGPAANTLLGAVQFKGNDSAGNETDYAKIKASLATSTNGAEGGYITLETTQSGVSTEVVRIDSSGNVGIGTTSPLSRLNVYQTSTETAAGTTYGTFNELYLNAGSNSSQTFVGDRSTVEILSGNSSDYGVVMASAPRVFHYGTGTITDARGNNLVMRNQDAGVITSGIGGNFTVANGSTGSYGTAYAGKFDFANSNAAGAIGTAYGAHISGTNAGTITNTYGLYVGDITSGTQTNTPFSVYASDANTYNYFAGNVGVGDTSPSALLNVGSGNVSTVDGVNDLFVTDDIEVDGDGFIAGALDIIGNITSAGWAGDVITAAYIADDIAVGSGGSIDSTALYDGGTISFDWVDAEVADALTVSGGTLGSNNISGTLTTTGALTIGDGGDTITVNSSNWDVSSTGVFTGGTWQGGVISSTYLDSTVILSSEIDTSSELRTIVTDETGSGSLVFNASPTLTGTLTLSSATNNGIELGRQDGTGSTPYMDFHSGATVVDYDARIIASGGTGASGGGTLTVTAGTFLFSGDVGIGSGATPDKRLEVFETVADDQFRISYDATRYTDFQVDSVGDLIIDAQGGDVRLNDENLHVCSGGACPSGISAGTGNAIIENDLYVAGGGASALGQATSTFQGDILILGKLDVGTIDPVYKIDETNYATYGLSSIGVKETVSETIMVNDYNEATGYYEKRIAWNDLPEASDLWLFYQVTDFGLLWEKLAVSLTAGFDGAVFYAKDVEQNALVIRTTEPGEVSAALFANRFDWRKWGNVRPDQDGHAHFEIDSKSPSGSRVPVSDE